MSVQITFLQLQYTYNQDTFSIVWPSSSFFFIFFLENLQDMNINKANKTGKYSTGPLFIKSLKPLQKPSSYNRVKSNAII